MAAYWAQVDRPTRSARVHRADCPYCNDGHGWQANRTGKYNTWHPADEVVRDPSLHPIHNIQTEEPVPEA